MDSEEEEEAAAAAAAARQRLLAAFVVLAEAAAARPGPKGKCRKKGHFKWEEHVQKLTEDEFKAVGERVTRGGLEVPTLGRIVT